MASFLIEAFAAIILLLPAFLILNRVHFHNGKRTALYFLFALYLAAVYNIVGLPTVQFLVFDATLSLVPFHPMAEDIRGTVLNVLLFVPLGFFLPLMWNKYRSLKSAALFGLGMTVAIELAQLLTWRVTDVNDILTNFAGTLVGCGGLPSFQTVYRWLETHEGHSGDLPDRGNRNVFGTAPDCVFSL